MVGTTQEWQKCANDARFQFISDITNEADPISSAFSSPSSSFRGKQASTVDGPKTEEDMCLVRRRNDNFSQKCANYV